MDESLKSPAQIIAEELLEELWPDKDWKYDQHLKGTPERLVRMLKEITDAPPVKWTTFDCNVDEMVALRGITFTSLCAHHLVPYMGVAHIAYVPDGRMCGLSKLARVVRHHAADLTVQEELTEAIATDIQERLEPIGVAVVMEAEHLCMSLRGVRAQDVQTTTSKMLGCFADHTRQARNEFLSLIARNG